MDFQITITDMRDGAAAARTSQFEFDCLISAGPQDRVGDLIVALIGVCDARARLPQGSGLPGLWLDGSRLDPATPLAASGIRDGSRLGLEGWPSGADRSAWPGTAEIRVVAGPDAGLVVPVGAGEYTVGRNGGDVALTNNDVSRAHCVISVSETASGVACTIRDARSTNGTGLDGVPVGLQPEPVRPGQLIAVGRDTLTIALPPAESAMVSQGDPSDPFGWRLSRPPRDHPIPPRPVVIDLGAEASQRERMPSRLTMLIGPAVSLAAGAAVGALTHQWLFLLLGLGGVVVTLVTQISGRRAAGSRLRSAQSESRGRAAAGQARLAEAIAAEQRQRRDALPDPAHLAQIARGPGTRLWERLPSDEDFLHLRVGSADLAADTVELRGSAAEAPQAMVRDVPVPVALRDLGVLGIAGPAQLSRPALAWMVSQLAVLHSPRDVRVVLLTEEPDAWRWARWLPHLRPLPGTAAMLSVGTDPETWATRAGELSDLVERRRAAAADPRRIDRRPPAPAVVVILDGAYRLSQQRGIATVLAEGPAVAVYTLCRGEDRAELPRECAGQVLVEPAGDGRASYRERGRQIGVRKLDAVNAQWADRVARALAPIRDAQGDERAGMPGSIRLLELWGLDRPDAAGVADEWQRRGRTTAVPLGRTAAGTFVLDIARDGPHMLVAGTTGAGKSEFLQTLVASLALGNTPDALVFVLIDYKGGAAFAGCSALPHVVGFLTDLDEHLTQRALVALAAEVRYRERLLLEARSKDIDDYHAAGQPCGPLPRLVLVVDEFRFLVEQMPDFLQRLTDVTARGRSLGIHLVLATQRPAGVVSEDIRTNMALRVCFRVEDAADSTAVVEFPDAAAIDRQFRGRGYARTERGAATLFQGGYVGGLPPGLPATGNALRAAALPFGMLGSPSPGRAPERDGPADDRTDLASLVQAIRGTRRQPPPHRAWLDPLPPDIPLRHLPVAGPRGAVHPIGYGVEDRPAEQSQRVIALDLETGQHLLVGGAPQSGRTTMLRTVAAGIAASQSPGDVHLYVLDCDAGALAPLARLPHCGAVVRRTEKERAARLLDRLATEISRRQEVLAASGFASVTEQRRAAGAAGRLPYMVLLLDRWEGFLADLGQADNGRLPELMARLLSEGASAGLRVVATGDKTALVRQTSQFPDRLVLRLADPNDLLMAGVPKGAMPASPPPGRGIIVPGGSEVQIAFAGDDPDGSAQTTALDAMIRDAAASWPPGPRPLRVDVIPARISLAQARAIPGWADARGPQQPAVAVGGDELSGLGIDLARFPGFAIAGPPLSGRSTALLVIAESLIETGTAVIALAPRQSPLGGLAGRGEVTAVFTDASPDPVKLAELLEAAPGPLAVLVDDAEALHQTPIAEVLAQIPVEGRGCGHALVIAGTSGELLRAVRGFTAAARQFRCGLLLTPEAAQLGQELFGTKLPRSAAFDRPPGRGYLIQGGQATLVQVPEPAASVG